MYELISENKGKKAEEWDAVGLGKGMILNMVVTAKA